MRAARSCYPAMTLLHLRRTAVLHLRSTAVILMGFCPHAPRQTSSRFHASCSPVRGSRSLRIPGRSPGALRSYLSVRLHQVDDILKSLTVFDKEGAIGGDPVRLEGAPGRTVPDLPFGPDVLEFLARQSSTHWLAARWRSAGPVNEKGASSGWRPRRSRSLTTAAARLAIVSRS